MKGKITFLSASLAFANVEWRGGMTPSLNWKGKGAKDSFEPQRTFREDTISSEAWPDFRGPKRDGVAPDQGLKLDWSHGPKRMWRQPAGKGHSSVIVISNRIYTAEQRGDQETLTCRSLQDGSILWERQEQRTWQDSMGGIGPRSTPVFSGGSIHFLSSGGDLTCLDAVSGKTAWKRHVLEQEYEYPHWGLASSPLVTEGLVIVSPVERQVQSRHTTPRQESLAGLPN